MFFFQYFSFPCQYHSTIAPYSFTHLPPTLYNVFLPVLQFSPVSIIPPLLHTHPSIIPSKLYNVFLPVLQFSPVSTIPPLPHTHSSIYHPLCIMFSPSTSVFPCQYHSTIAPHTSSSFSTISTLSQLTVYIVKQRSSLISPRILPKNIQHAGDCGYAMLYRFCRVAACC